MSRLPPPTARASGMRSERAARRGWVCHRVLRNDVKQSTTLRPLPSTALQFCLYSHSLALLGTNFRMLFKAWHHGSAPLCRQCSEVAAAPRRSTLQVPHALLVRTTVLHVCIWRPLCMSQHLPDFIRADAWMQINRAAQHSIVTNIPHNHCVVGTTASQTGRFKRNKAMHFVPCALAWFKSI